MSELVNVRLELFFLLCAQEYSRRNYIMMLDLCNTYYVVYTQINIVY